MIGGAMKGVVFNLLEAFVVENWGEEAYESILDLCPLETKEPFVGPGTYPDSDLLCIATAAARRVGVPLPDALRAFGTFAFPHLADRFPSYAEEKESATAFLLGVHEVIHVEVRKLMPEAVTPSFEYRSDGGGLVVRYRSERKLCHFMEGLLVGLGERYGTPVQQEQRCCMHDGAPHCDFVLRFVGEAEQAA